MKQIQSTQCATFQKQTQQKAPLLEIDYKLTEGLQKIGRPLVKRNIKAFLRSFKPSPPLGSYLTNQELQVCAFHENRKREKGEPSGVQKELPKQSRECSGDKSLATGKEVY